MIQWHRYLILALAAGALACTGANGSGAPDPGGPGPQDPPSPEPPPDDGEDGAVTIAGSDRTYATIQAALEAASHGDVLELEPGTYRGAIVVTRAVTLRGSQGSSVTVLDGDDDERVVTIAPEVGDGLVRIEGVRFRFGDADPGGAIRVSSGRLECENCVFDRCTSPDRAGAVAVESASGSPGTRATFLDCVFRECSSGARGGAVYLTAGTDDSSVEALFERCRFEGNVGNQGGAVFASAGAGMATVAATFDRCVFEGNSGKDGGALLAESGSGSALVRLEAVNCLFSRNTATGEGSAVRARAFAGEAGVEVRLVHCTITGNVAPNLPGLRGAVATTRGASAGSVRLELFNSILWDDAPRELDATDVQRVISNNIVMGGEPGPGNLDANPQFLFPDGGNHALRAGSPAIDAGDLSFVPAGSALDLAGNPRVRGAAPDLGAFERE